MNTFPRWLKAAIGVAMLALLAGFVWFYRAQEQYLRHAAEEDLNAIAKLKVDQIITWRADRLSDATVMMESPFFTKAVENWMTEPRAGDSEKIITRFRSIQKNYA